MAVHEDRTDKRWQGLAALAGAFLDLVYPRSCQCCGKQLDALDQRYICWDCMMDNDYIKPPYCQICGQPVEGYIDHAYQCHSCSADPKYFDHARSCALYGKTIRDAILALKYSDGLWLVPDLAGMLATGYRVHYGGADYEGILAVPLYNRKQRERGYNQAGALARELSKNLHIPFYGRMIKRVRMTRTQTKLTAAQRKTNVRRAFSVQQRAWLSGRRFLLVDDVMTTGATVNECARALKEAGVGRVDVLTLARGII